MVDIGNLVLRDYIDNGTKHKHYAHMVKKAVWCRAMFAGGDGYTDIVKELRPKETDEQKAFRAAVSYPETPEVLESIQTVCQRIFRVDGINELCEHTDAAQKEDILKAVGSFAGNTDVESYLKDRQLYYEFIDPNAWLIVERKDERDVSDEVRAIHTYPLEVLSHQAVNYQVENNKPLWLLAEIDGVLYFYAAGVTITARKLGKKEGAAQGETTYTSKAKQTYAFREYLNDTKTFPGEKFGGYHDHSVDDMSVKAPIYNPARGVLHRIVTRASLLAVDIMAHCYKKMYAYDEPCTFDDSFGRGCGNRDDGNFSSNCPACGGTGSTYHKSELDITHVMIPEQMEDGGDARTAMKLSDLIYTVSPDIVSTRFTYELLESDKARVDFTVFNSTQGEKPVVSTTATEQHFNRDNSNSRIAPLATRNALLREMCYQATAEHLNFDKGFEYGYEYPSEFSIETEAEMLARLGQAREKGAPAAVVNRISWSIVSKQYAGDIHKSENFAALQAYYPMQHLPENSVATILSLRDPMDYTRVLYENWSQVERIIYEAFPEFYTMTSEEKAKALGDVVSMVRDGILMPVVEVPTLDFSVGLDDETEGATLDEAETTL